MQRKDIIEKISLRIMELFQTTIPDKEYLSEKHITRKYTISPQDIAEAALDALLDELPEIIITGDETYISTIIDKEEQMVEIYTELLNMKGKDNDG